MRSRILLLCMLPLAFLLMAFRQAPLVNPPPIAVSPNVAIAEVPKAIKIALLRGWTMTADKPGEVDATLHLREHTADIAITYDAHQIQIAYVNSTNLKYETTRNGERLIHKNYLGWIQNLVVDIQANLIQAGG